ncbi:ATP-binding protein [Sideroxydans lithotrophicus]|uniref:histidine kinase n=1 Tax=Sideroxydans lithotrophicus (strain ES-1) TaxID=580332 RepID=D5CQL4_SIDLE|nr:ATP-binding protein [Sideroxydans lithotrophicus]ADE11250.1 histidine kinase [Sideroxydans lithotrophicus ES-1]
MSETRGHGSLKRRLLALSITTVVIVWCAAAAFTYYDARDEFDEMFDEHLAQSASLLIVQSSHELGEIETEHIAFPHKYSRRVAFQIWERGRVLRLHSANAPEQPLADRVQGFSDKIIDGRHWRVFSTWDESGKNLIHVAESTQDRDELAREIAGNLLKPLLISLPFLALLLWIAVARGLRPLVLLTDELVQRAPDNLAAFAAGTAPREVVPLIERLNKLFARIETSLQKERRFTADAAHELRTPVAAIKAQAQVARTASAETERAHALDNAILGCDRAAHLIEQLLTLARIDTLGDEVTEPCRLKEIASEVISSIAPMALSQNVRLELTMGGEETVVRGNPVLLRILLRNLIDNAVRHTRPGTSVEIGIAEEHGRVSLSVSDNGPGIPEAELDKVAERFYRPLGTSASGSGLGLSIVKRIAEIHSATLQLSPKHDGNGLNAMVVFKP